MATSENNTRPITCVGPSDFAAGTPGVLDKSAPDKDDAQLWFEFRSFCGANFKSALHDSNLDRLDACCQHSHYH